MIKERGLIGKTVLFKTGYTDKFFQPEIKEGLVLDKVLVSSKGVHSTGMFHWVKDYPYSILTEWYLVQIDEPHGNDYEGYDKDGNGYGEKQTL